MTRVLPVPAPARIKTGPWMVSTASRCCGLRALRLSIAPRSLMCDELKARKESGCIGVILSELEIEWFPDGRIVAQNHSFPVCLFRAQAWLVDNVSVLEDHGCADFALAFRVGVSRQGAGPGDV